MKRFSLIISLIVLSTFTLIAGGQADTTMNDTEESLTSGDQTETMEEATTEFPLEAYNVRVGALKGPTAFGAIQLFENVPNLGEGVTSEYMLMGTPQEMVAKMSSGQIEAAVLPVNLAAKMYTAGPKYSMGGVVGNGMIYALSRDTEITSWNALKDKTVAVAGQGATPDYLLQFFLSQNQMSTEDIDINYAMSAPQIAQAVIAGQIDTVVVPEPFATMIQLKSPDMKLVLNFQDEWMTDMESSEIYPMTVVVLSPDFLATRPDAADAFLAAYADSIAWVNANPTEAAVLIEKFGVMAATMAKPAIPGCNLVFIPAQDSKPAVENFLSVLKDFNPASIGGSLPDENFYRQ